MPAKHMTLLGKLPEPWWSKWVERSMFFDEDGRPIHAPLEYQTSIRGRLQQIHARDQESDPRIASIYEKAGTALTETDVAVLGDLLEKMLRYDPEERITMNEVLKHPWFRC
jgi:serine/threonine-protein kinase SRPK3